MISKPYFICSQSSTQYRYRAICRTHYSCRSSWIQEQAMDRPHHPPKFRDRVGQAIRTRHYRRRAEKSCWYRIRHFIRIHGMHLSSRTSTGAEQNESRRPVRPHGLALIRIGRHLNNAHGPS
jgi:hypothetical protein